MDPYGEQHRKIKSPLDQPKAIVKTLENTTGKSEVIEPELPGDSVAIEKESFVSHLTELQKQLIKSVGVFLLFFIGVFSTINLWFPYVTRGYSLIVLGPLEVIKFYMSMSTAMALGLSLPFLCRFAWKFARSGLNEVESHFLHMYTPVMLLLFLAGVSFGYFVVNPLSYTFLLSLGAVNFDVMVSAQEYMRFLLMTTMPIGLLFELPIITLFLATIGVLTAASMKKVRKWSYIAIGVVSALITPPDFISQLLILIPMVLLYEASIWLVLMKERKKIG